ncbi:MAG: cytochrome c [Alphaproteobacteria bacterium]|nr:cytochrome c [Alphaproteobacteria bacterium]
MKPWLRLTLGAPLLAAVIAGTWAVWRQIEAPASPADPNDRAMVALGKDVYGRHCLSCHGRNLEGERDWRTPKANGRLPAPPHDETGHTWHHSDRQLFVLTKVGPRAFAGPNYQTDMPGYADTLSDREIWAVIAYIKSTWPNRVLAYQQDVTGRDR